jgi:hypothetical protein
MGIKFLLGLLIILKELYIFRLLRRVEITFYSSTQPCFKVTSLLYMSDAYLLYLLSKYSEKLGCLRLFSKRIDTKESR